MEQPYANINSTDILSWFRSFDLNKEEEQYLEEHATRIAYFINLTAKYAKLLLPQEDVKLRILDIGPHFLTYALRQYFGSSIILNTLGWENPHLVPPGTVEHHFHFDLNDAQNQQKWLPSEAHDIIVMVEVVEHLYTAPDLVFSFIKTFLNSTGILIVGTPNAVSVQKRIKMLIGKNPYEMIRKDNTNPGHFREYTADELKEIFQRVELKCQELEYHDFSSLKTKSIVLKHWIKQFNVSFKDYLSIVLAN